MTRCASSRGTGRPECVSGMRPSTLIVPASDERQREFLRRFIRASADQTRRVMRPFFFQHTEYDE